MPNASMLERLSCNIFITNFPAYFSSKDLWNTCSKYGTVLDVYIPNKDRIVWIDVEGIPLREWSKTTFNKIARKWGELIFMDDSNSANKYSLRICVKTTFFHLIAESLKVIIKGKVYVVRAKEVTGWVPEFGEDNSDEYEDYSDNNWVGKKNWVESEEGEIIPESVQNDAFIYNIAESEPINGDSRENQFGQHILKPLNHPSGDPFGLEDLIRKLAKKSNKVAHEMNDINPKFPPGFTPQYSDHYEYQKVEALRESTTLQDSKKVRNDQTFHHVLEESVNKSSGVSKTAHADSMAGLGGVKKKQWVKKLCHSNQVNFLSIQETKMVSLDVFVVKNLWGNMLFDFATSSARGRSGGTWKANNADLLFIYVYSPQELSLKRVLWNYMLETLNRWHSEVILMGDFNEVRFTSKRHGSYFHSLNATEFNMFIANSQLIDIPLGGLILHRHLSDHRPILLKETHVDYGPTPFCLYHSWFMEDDFHSVIEDSWNNDGISASNSMILKNKLNFLKQRLKEWSSIKRRNKDHDRKVIQDSLIEIDLRLDKGNGLPDDLTKRVNLFRDLNDIDHKDSIDLAQKAKIKWAVERDENSNFFHGIVNKKRRHLAIKAWDRSLFDVNFPRRLNSDQVFDLEDMIWRFLASSSRLWIKVIKSIHGNFGALDNPYSSRLKNSTGIGILKAINKLKVKGVDLMGFCKIVIRNGITTIFWHDIWYGDICFKEKFKRLFNLELQKDANVASKLQASNVAFSFRRPPLSGPPLKIVIIFFSCSMSVDLARLIGRWWNIHIPIFDDPSSWDSWLNDEIDLYDLDFDEVPTAQASFMDNLSSYGSDALSEVPYSDTYPSDMINQEVQEMSYSKQTHIDDYPDNEINSNSNIISYSKYLQESQDAGIQDTNSSARNDLLLLSLVEQITDQVANLDKENQTNKLVNESLTAELERYKEHVAIFEQRINADSNNREKLIDSQMNDLIQKRNAKFAAFQQDINTLKETLSNNVKEKESLSKNLTVFKTESKEKEFKYIDKEIVLEKQNKELENIISGIKEVVSENQSAFVPGRRISDNILITQELMHNYHRNVGPPRCSFKVDIQKAYDTVDWHFLECIIKQFGFLDKMVKWVMTCVTTASFSLHINGDVHGFFKGKSGLRQGLAILNRFNIINNVKSFRLLMFVLLMTFLFTYGDMDSAKLIMDTLDEFKLVSGLVPSIPKSIINDIEQLMRGFLWCNGDLKKGKAKVAWRDICLPKNEGGLGLYNVIVPPYVDNVIVPPYPEPNIPLRANLGVLHRWSGPFIISEVYPYGTAKLVHSVGSNFKVNCHRLKHYHGGDTPPLEIPDFQTLKTQDMLRPWDVGPAMDLSSLRCPLCNNQQDSHEHLFFECAYTAKVWGYVRDLTDLNDAPPVLMDIFDLLQQMGKSRKVRSIFGKLILAATTYFVWNERNSRLFKNMKRSPEDIRDVIMVKVRLKLLTFRFKNKPDVVALLQRWKMPRSFWQYGS
nr:RNA-directed DNA polymerase, eukaryota, reverse transcriptase zinc-binding domain protein [Tanacetum cinerariifolium]